MDEIKVGEFIKTKNGKIRKVKSTVAQYYITDRLNISDNNQFVREDIVNHSFNIIDLIEIGDVVEVVVAEDFEEEYIEKLEVAAVGITDCKGNKLNEVGICGDDEIEYVSLKDIKSILTHELYERNCYRIN